MDIPRAETLVACSENTDGSCSSTRVTKVDDQEMDRLDDRHGQGHEKEENKAPDCLISMEPLIRHMDLRVRKAVGKAAPASMMLL